MEWLSGVGGVLFILGLRYLLMMPLRRARAAARGEDAVDATPFCEEQYAENHAGSRDWELQQAMRRAGTLAKKGKTAEAVAVLTGVRAAVTDSRVREVLDAEIRRLGGTPPV